MHAAESLLSPTAFVLLLAGCGLFSSDSEPTVGSDSDSDTDSDADADADSDADTDADSDADTGRPPSPGRLSLYVGLYNDFEVVEIDLGTLQVVDTIAVPPYHAYGLDFGPRSLTPSPTGDRIALENEGQSFVLETATNQLTPLPIWGRNVFRFSPADPDLLMLGLGSHVLPYDVQSRPAVDYPLLNPLHYVFFDSFAGQVVALEVHPDTGDLWAALLPGPLVNYGSDVLAGTLSEPVETTERLYSSCSAGAFAILSGGRAYASCVVLGELRRIDMVNDSTTIVALGAAPPRTLVAAPDESVVAVMDADSELYFVDPATDTVVGSPVALGGSEVATLAFSPDSSLVVSAHYENDVVTVVDVATRIATNVTVGGGPFYAVVVTK